MTHKQNDHPDEQLVRDIASALGEPPAVTWNRGAKTRSLIRDLLQDCPSCLRRDSNAIPARLRITISSIETIFRAETEDHIRDNPGLAHSLLPDIERLQKMLDSLRMRCIWAIENDRIR